MDRAERPMPFRLGPPVWVDAANFDLRYHLRQTALPAPGGDEQLRNLIAPVMTQRLDRDYPLWEYWLVEGLTEGRWALISKVHHCMVDGISATELYRVIFDLTPDPSPPVVETMKVPPELTGLELAASAAVDMVARPARGALALASALTRPRQTAGRLAAIRAEMADLKAIREASAGDALIALGQFTPYPLASLTVRLAYRLPQREIVTVTTNVPGHNSRSTASVVDSWRSSPMFRSRRACGRASRFLPTAAR
jgi:hypothetical protein